MTAVARTNPISLCACGGLTVYVAIVLTHAAAAAVPVPPPPAPAAESAGTGPYGAFAPRPDLGTPPPPGSPTPYGPLPPPAPPFRDGPYGAHADPGFPDSPAFGHPHYRENQTRYGVWYQPRAYAEPFKQVYRPSPFRPRGNGNMFYDPCRRDRMDYVPAVVDDLPSRYGPAYYPNYSERSECLVRPTRKYVPPVWGSAEGTAHR